MKEAIIILLFLVSSLSSYSQFNTDNISFELRYPTPLGSNLFNKGLGGNGYTGLIDIGLAYDIVKIKNLGIGVLYNSSFFRHSSVSITSITLSPKVKLDYTIDLNKISIIPQFGVGYSNLRYRSLSEFPENENGLTIIGATRILLNLDKRIKWYFIFSYEFTRIGKIFAPIRDYMNNIHLIYPGIGMNWNFRKN